MTAADPARRAWTAVEQAIPAGWFRGEIPDALDTRLDVLLDAAARAAAAGRGPGVVDLDESQELEARMLQSYAVRAATRAVRDDDPALVHRAALALVIGSPAADYRDQLRVIAVVTDAARRVGTSLAELIAGLRPSRDEVHLRRLIDFDGRPRRERRLTVMEYKVQGRGAVFTYVSRWDGDPAASARELADLMETAGFPPDVVAKLRADADGQMTPRVEGGDVTLDHLRGETVTKVSFDTSVYLLFDRAGEIHITSPLSLTDGSGVRRWAEGEPVEVTGSLVALMWATVHDVAIDESTGHLTVEFEDGRQIDVTPDEDDQAWSYTGERGHTITCRPGGELLVVDPVAQLDPPSPPSRSRWSRVIHRQR